MIQSDEFSELVLYYDSREQSNVEGRPRVKRIVDWFKQRGGTMIEEMALPLTDYVICGGYDTDTKKFLHGMFRDKEICLGIEYKTMTDYSTNGKDLDWKLIEAYQYFTQVALFVEEGNISLSFVEGKTYIKNPAVPNGKADVMVYEHYKNETDRLSQIADIHIRTFPYETFIDVNLDSLMVLLSEKPDVRLYCRGTDKDKDKSAFITSLIAIPKIGISTAMKIAEVYPNLDQFVNHLHYDGEFEKIAGTLTGKRIRAFLTDNSRAESCMEAYQKLFPSPQHNESQSSQISKGKADTVRQQVIKPQTVTSSCEVHSVSDERLRPHCSRIADLHDISSSSSAEHSEKQPSQNQALAKNRMSAQPSSGLEDKSKLGTPDTLLSQCDPAGTILKKSSLPIISSPPAVDSHPSLSELRPPPTTPVKPSGDDRQDALTPRPVATSNVITSLDDAIVDFCYKVPKLDTEIIAAFQYKGYKMIDIHKAMNTLSKTKLRKYQDKGVTMYSFCGVRGDTEMDVGV